MLLVFIITMKKGGTAVWEIGHPQKFTERAGAGMWVEFRKLRNHSGCDQFLTELIIRYGIVWDPDPNYSMIVG